MSEGLWITPDRFLSFEEINRASLGDEIATREASWDWISLLGLLPDPDPVLRQMQEGSAILESLTADGHLISVIQSRKLGTLKKEFNWTAGSLKDADPTPQAGKLRDDLVEDLENVDLYQLVSGILDAPLYGMAPLEILWQPGRGRMRIRDIQSRPQRWFGFDEQNRPRFITRDNPFDGRELPFGKFVFARHFPTYDNPFGLRLLSRCFWPVVFKRGGIKFWVTLAEKYGMPFLVGHYGKGTSPADQQAMLNKLAAMVRSAVAVLPQGDTVDILESAGKASADIHSGLKSAMDAEMSKVIMGQTLTAEVSDLGGSRAQGQVHEDILEDFRQGDQKLVKTALEEIAWVYGLVNAPGVPSPRFSWFEENDPKKETADRDKTLKETGVNFKKSYYVRVYGLKEDEFELTAETGQPADIPGKEFSEPGNRQQTARNAEDQGDDALPLAVENLARRADPEVSAWIDHLQGLAAQAESLEELRDLVLNAFPGLDDQALAGIFAEETMRAHMIGRMDVDDG